MKHLTYLMVLGFLFAFNAHANLEEIFGNGDRGDECLSDYQCQSLCCSRDTGTCRPHDPDANQPVFCQKPVGEQCVAHEFCKSEYIPVCKVVKGPSINGKLTCTLSCPLVLTQGKCKKGVCTRIAPPPVPPFDPNDCSNAVDP